MEKKSQANLIRILIIALAFLIPFSIGAEFGYNNLKQPVLSPPINYSKKNVNSSEYWDNLDTPADIQYSALDDGNFWDKDVDIGAHDFQAKKVTIEAPSASRILEVINKPNTHTDNFYTQHAGPINSSNIAWVFSIRSNNKDFWLYSYNGSLCKNWVKFQYDNDKTYLLGDLDLNKGDLITSGSIQAKNGTFTDGTNTIKLIDSTNSRGFSSVTTAGDTAGYFSDGVNYVELARGPNGAAYFDDGGNYVEILGQCGDAICTGGKIQAYGFTDGTSTLQLGSPSLLDSDLDLQSNTLFTSAISDYGATLQMGSSPWILDTNLKIDGELQVQRLGLNTSPSSSYLINAKKTYTHTSGTDYAVYVEPTLKPSSAGFPSLVAMSFRPIADGNQNILGLTGMQFNPTINHTSGLLIQVVGMMINPVLTATSSSSTSNLIGMRITNPARVSGSSETISSLYGLIIENQHEGTNNHGLWLNGDEIGSDIVFGQSKDVSVYWNDTNQSLEVTNNLRVDGDILYSGSLVSFSPTIFCDAHSSTCLAIDFKSKKTIWCDKETATCSEKNPEVENKLKKLKIRREKLKLYLKDKRACVDENHTYVSFNEWLKGERTCSIDKIKLSDRCREKYGDYASFNPQTLTCSLNKQKKCEEIPWRYWKNGKCRINHYLECKLSEKRFTHVWQNGQCVYNEKKAEIYNCIKDGIHYWDKKENACKLNKEKACLIQKDKIWKNGQCIDAQGEEVKFENEL